MEKSPAAVSGRAFWFQALQFSLTSGAEGIF
jgi:hypothetical protein